MSLFSLLIIDDQDYKKDDIINCINKSIVEIDHSYDTFVSKKLLKSKSYNLIILDISLNENVYLSNDFSGIDILDYLDEEKIDTPVIVLSQFYNFNDLSQSSNKRGLYFQNDYFKKEHKYECPSDIDMHLLPNLHTYLSQNYFNYFGCILYIIDDKTWINSLSKMMYKIGGVDYENIIIRR